MSIKSNFWVIVFVVILFSLFVWPQATARANLPIIEVSGNITTDTTWTSSNIYVITGHLTIDEHITLTIHQGTIIKFDGNKLMAVNGKLIVQGTPSNPVYITSLKDDTLGGDTNGDGVASSPQPGDWGHINFRDSSTDAENLIENTVIQYGGYFNAYHNEYYDCYNCAYHGVLRFEGSSPTIRGNQVRYNNYGLFTTNGALPLVTNNAIYKNEYYGFYNEDSGVVVKAENNWWGAVSGPYHSSNPGGTGNQVSNNVDFKPWLSASPVQ